MRNARRRWAWISSILGQEGADPRTFGTFYKELVQETLMFSADTWVTTSKIGRTLGGFHHIVAHWIVGMQTSKDTPGRWVNTPLDK